MKINVQREDEPRLNDDDNENNDNDDDDNDDNMMY